MRLFVKHYRHYESVLIFLAHPVLQNFWLLRSVFSFLFCQRFWRSCIKFWSLIFQAILRSSKLKRKPRVINRQWRVAATIFDPMYVFKSIFLAKTFELCQLRTKYQKSENILIFLKRKACGKNIEFPHMCYVRFPVYVSEKVISWPTAVDRIESGWIFKQKLKVCFSSLETCLFETWTD